jgi:hypothetical protein
MSRHSKYTGFAEQPAPTPDAAHDRCASHGVDVVLRGWREGLNKVSLTKTLRAGGIRLNEASKLTGQILNGAEIRVHLNQFPTLASAHAELTKIGVREVRG